MVYLFGRFSLVGFCFIKLLCWNVCWLAGSWMLDSCHFCNQFSGLWCPWVSFGMLGASTLASWGTLGRSWDIGGHKEGPCGVQAWILLIFWWFWGPILKVVWAFLDQKKVFFISISKLFFLLVFGSKFRCLGLKNMHLALEVLQKSTSVKIGFLMIPGSIFHDFG